MHGYVQAKLNYFSRKIVMNQTSTPKLDSKINRFVKSLKKDHSSEIAKDPGAFRATVLGKLKPKLPRRRPGRQGSTEIKRAAEIYKLKFKSPGKPANWHLIALEVFSDYKDLSPDLQRLRRISVRAAVHCQRYEERSRRKRTGCQQAFENGDRQPVSRGRP
jgi:hypothetical protein